MPGAVMKLISLQEQRQKASMELPEWINHGAHSATKEII